ncbi:hypothetical protein BJ742DRAFT_799902 [Cladochytrium replicatum]|nr:hypothetical protein BJ742DRAFT_799902 [Cladochytrium replicatum]
MSSLTTKPNEGETPHTRGSDDGPPAKLSRIGTCEVCSIARAKYTCPRCGRQTCSVSCVRTHKSSDGCSGERSRTDHVRLSEYTENNLWDDYSFLQDASRIADIATRDNNTNSFGNAQKGNVDLGGGGRYDPRTISLQKQSRIRGIQLKHMAVGMQRNLANQSSYNARTSIILWSIEWVFPKVGKSYIEHSVQESRTVGQAMEDLIGPEASDSIRKYELREYASCQTIRVVMRRENTSASERRHDEVDTNATIREALCGKVVLEFPRFEVYLGTEEHLASLSVEKWEAHEELRAQYRGAGAHDGVVDEERDRGSQRGGRRGGRWRGGGWRGRGGRGRDGRGRGGHRGRGEDISKE